MRTIVALATCGFLTRAGQALENGSFEDCDRTYLRNPGQQVPKEVCLPEWSTRYKYDLIFYAGAFSQFRVIMLYDDKARESDTTGLINTLPIAGDIAVGVIPRAYPDNQGRLVFPPYLEQLSLVPVEARTLWFLWQGERLDLRINRKLTPFVLAEQRLTDDPFVPVHDYYAADISQFAGQEVTIRFEFYANELHAFAPWPGAVQALDDIYFSSIPEPSTLALFALGAGGLLLAARRRPRPPTRGNLRAGRKRP